MQFYDMICSLKRKRQSISSQAKVKDDPQAMAMVKIRISPLVRKNQRNLHTCPSFHPSSALRLETQTTKITRILQPHPQKNLKPSQVDHQRHHNLIITEMKRNNKRVKKRILRMPQ